MLPLATGSLFSGARGSSSSGLMRINPISRSLATTRVPPPHRIPLSSTSIPYLVRHRYNSTAATSAAANSTATLSPSEAEHLATPSSSSTSSPPLPPDAQVGYLYFDSLYPIKLGFWDIRSWLVQTDHRSLEQRLRSSLPDPLTVGHGFTVLGAEERLKDGGGFLSFAYTPVHAPPPEKEKWETRDEALVHIEAALKKGLKRSYSPLEALTFKWRAIPSVHVVRGTPWLEDLDRYPAHGIKINLSGGGDVSEEALWSVLRPYGRLVSIDKKPNEAYVLFSRMRSATSARNCAHGLQLPNGGPTLIINYQGTQRVKRAFDWMSSHPRIMFPILAFLLGGFTYAIFDPIRQFFIEAKLSGTFDLKHYRAYTWLKQNTVDLLRDDRDDKNAGDDIDWFERRAAKESIQGWLREEPETFITVSGPKGSGKHKLVKASLPKGTKTLDIDIGDIAKKVGSSTSNSSIPVASDGKDGGTGKLDTALVSALASETGYWPVFGWLNSMNSMIDLAAVGLIGSKAGFSRPAEEQLSQILQVTTNALEALKASEEKKAAKLRKRLQQQQKPQSNGTTSDAPAASQLKTAGPSGNLQEHMNQADSQDEVPNEKGLAQEAAAAEMAQEKGLTVQVPVVIIDNFHLKSLRSPLLYSVLVDWASHLVSSNLAHVIFISDNGVGMSKEIGRSLPDGRPANNVVLADAELGRAREFVRSRMREARQMGLVAEQKKSRAQPATVGDEKKAGSSATSVSGAASGLLNKSADLFRSVTGTGSSDSQSGTTIESSSSPTRGDTDSSPLLQDDASEVLPEEDAQWVDKLGGRLTDLEALLQKVALGQTVPTAVSDLISRTTVELRKNFFGDDSGEGSSSSSTSGTAPTGLPWSRSTAWSLIRLLATSPDGSLPYHWTLHSDSGAFKGDESKLRAMEEAELLSVRHKDGRPSSIRAGRPVLLEAMRQLVHGDSTFRLTQELLDGKSGLAKSNAGIEGLEKEMERLGELTRSLGNGRAVNARLESLSKKLEGEQKKVESLEKRIEEIQGELKALD